MKRAYSFLLYSWHFDGIYNHYIAKPVLRSYFVTYQVIDRGLLEMFGPFGVSRKLSQISVRLSALQSGQIYNYAFTIFVFTTFFLTIISQADYFAPRLELFLLLPIFIYIYFNSEA